MPSKWLLFPRPAIYAITGSDLGKVLHTVAPGHSWSAALVPPPRRGDATRPPRSKDEARIKFSQFLYISSCRIAIATGRKTRTKPWLAQPRLLQRRNATYGHLGRDLGAHTTGPCRTDERQPTGFSISKDLETTAPVTQKSTQARWTRLLRPWTRQVDKLWRFVVGPTGSVLFSEHPPLLRQYSLFFLFFYFFSPPLSLALSYVLHHPRKAAVYSSHVFIYHSFFFFSFSLPPLSSDEPRDDHRSLHGLTSCYTHCRTQAYILLLHYSSMRIYVFSLYIYTCIHTITTTSFAYIYIWTHCHTRAHTLLLYVYSYIYTHYTYII